MTEILLPMIVDGVRKGDEVIPVEPLGGARFRVAASPGMVEGLAAGDEIEVDPTELTGYRLLRRGGNLCAWFYFAQPVDPDHPSVDSVSASVESVGGWLDGGQGAMIVFTIPVTAGFAAVARMFDSAVAQHPGSQWLYGNVYDPKDGKTPLDWWR